jgi:hypothetical protein
VNLDTSALGCRLLDRVVAAWLASGMRVFRPYAHFEELPIRLGLAPSDGLFLAVYATCRPSDPGVHLARSGHHQDRDALPLGWGTTPYRVSVDVGGGGMKLLESLRVCGGGARRCGGCLG